MGHLLDIIEPETEAGPADAASVRETLADPVPSTVPLGVDEQPS
jgi:3,4-dihydroxy 2-butanone 4-phosphate synthase/GTP cyclohydrolase II